MKNQRVWKEMTHINNFLMIFFCIFSHFDVEKKTKEISSGICKHTAPIYIWNCEHKCAGMQSFKRKERNEWKGSKKLFVEGIVNIWGKSSKCKTLYASRMKMRKRIGTEMQRCRVNCGLKFRQKLLRPLAFRLAIRIEKLLKYFF